MNTYLRALLATICTIALLQSPLFAAEPALPTVTQVDLERYAGRPTPSPSLLVLGDVNHLITILAGCAGGNTNQPVAANGQLLR